MTIRPDDEEAGLLVASTAVGSDKFEPQEHPTTAGDLLALFDSLEDAGRGYLEVRFERVDYPMLTIGLRNERAVLQCFTAPGELDVMQGDGCLPPGGLFDVPVMDEAVSFDSEFVVNGARARTVLSEFAAGNPLDRLGTWQRL